MKSKLNDRIRELHIIASKKRIDEIENPARIVVVNSYINMCINALRGCKEIEDYYNEKLKSIISLN